MSDEEVREAVRRELIEQIPTDRFSTCETFYEQLQTLPAGLRAMAASYELDVSIALDDLGWHFGNWHHKGLAHECLAGLRELGAVEYAEIFERAFEIVEQDWDVLGAPDWSDNYLHSPLSKALSQLNDQAWEHYEKRNILDYWASYTRAHPDRVFQSSS